MAKTTFRFQLQDCAGVGRFVVYDAEKKKQISPKFKERQEGVKWAFGNLNDCNELQYRPGKKVYHRKDYAATPIPTTKQLKDLGKRLEKVRDLKKEVMKEVIEPLANANKGDNGAWEPAFIRTNSGNYTVVVGVKTHTFGRSHKNYDKLEKAIVDKDLVAFENNIETAISVRKFLGETNKIQVKDGEIIFNGETVHHVIVDRIFEAMEKGLPHENLVKFLENLLQNPNAESIEAVYKFLEDKSLPITPDGFFIAYKKANNNVKDWRTDTFDNSVGAKPHVDRKECDSNRLHDCGYGLHCGSLNFAKNLFYPGQGVLMLVKTNPKDVVSVPADIQCEKFRTCEYEVLEMLEDYRPKPVEPEPKVDEDY